MRWASLHAMQCYSHYNTYAVELLDTSSAKFLSVVYISGDTAVKGLNIVYYSNVKHTAAVFISAD